MWSINIVGVWLVVFIGVVRWVGFICKYGYVVGFYMNWKLFRIFFIDMVVFVINLRRLLVERFEVWFDFDIKFGFLEILFFE